MVGPPKEHSPSLSPLSIRIHIKPLLHSSFQQSLAFELLIVFYYVLLAIVGSRTQNRRVIVYCIIFIANQAIKTLDSLLDTIDPLGIQPVKKMFTLIGWGVKVNLLYQLTALAYLEQPLPVIIMSIHFLISNYQKSKPSISNASHKGKSYYRIMDFINPILLYSFLKQFDTEQSDLSIIFLIFLCINLVCASQIRLILANQQSDFAGWSLKFKENEKSEVVWDKDYAIKLIIIACSVTLVLQNMLLVFDSIKNQICLNILHTLIIGGTAFLKSHQRICSF